MDNINGNANVMTDTEKNESKTETGGRLLLFLILFALFLVITGVFILNLNLYSQNEKIFALSKSQKTEDIQNTQTEKRAILYIMKEHDGKISVYDAEQNEIIQILDVYVFTLPETDRKFLKDGINIYSDAELRQLIEDYTG